MRVALSVLTVALTLAACSSTPPATAPPPDFPDLGTYRAVDTADYDVNGVRFVTPQQISCTFELAPEDPVVCSGHLPGLPDSVSGPGCPSVRKADPAKPDSPYAFERSGPDCASSRFKPIDAGTKLSTADATCAVAEDGMVACIDADNKHGFVLKSTDSWAF